MLKLEKYTLEMRSDVGLEQREFVGRKALKRHIFGRKQGDVSVQALQLHFDVGGELDIGVQPGEYAVVFFNDVPKSCSRVLCW